MARIETIGQIDGTEVQALTLTGAGLRVTLLTWGARLAELWVPDASGTAADIVLGHDSLADWQVHGTYVGATADAAIAVGLGANVLVGGSENSIALQPISVEGQTGVNIAAGLAAFKLEYVQ